MNLELYGYILIFLKSDLLLPFILSLKIYTANHPTNGPVHKCPIPVLDIFIFSSAGSESCFSAWFGMLLLTSLENKE